MFSCTLVQGSAGGGERETQEHEIQFVGLEVTSCCERQISVYTFVSTGISCRASGATKAEREREREGGRERQKNREGEERSRGERNSGHWNSKRERYCVRREVNVAVFVF